MTEGEQIPESKRIRDKEKKDLFGQNSRYRMSLTTQMVLVMLLLVGGIVSMYVFFNAVFLEGYYRQHKKVDLQEAYQTIENARANGTLTRESFDGEFERLCANGNLYILVYRTNQMGIDEVLRSSFSKEQLMDISMSRIRQYLYGESTDITKVIEEKDDYIMESQQVQKNRMEYMVLAGRLADRETVVYIRTAVEPIRESAAITGRFFLQVGIAVMILGVIVIVFMARGISRPIRVLTDNSIHMTNMEFDVKYKPQRFSAKEIDVLGTHMNELSGTLEEKIAELKVANNELQKDIEKKEKIDEMRKEFVSNVSHELKTPLALIQGYAEGLRDGIAGDPENSEFYTDVIVDEAGKMNRMVKKLLTLNQLEFGNEVVDMSRFNITELIKGVVNANRIFLDNEQIELDFEEEDPSYVWGDEFKVEEVITNYLSNAIHYCKRIDDKKKIRIFYERREELLRISVFNTGDPIPEEDLEKVWIKFYKVDKARTREYGGNGIGLSIVKAIMDSFNRGCGVINRGNGVEFWVELEHSN